MTAHEFQLFGCRFTLACWGIFEAVDGQVHVAPCNAEGDLSEPHELTWRCPCNPEHDEGICSHNDCHVEH